MISFDDVLPELLRITTGEAGVAAIKTVCVVRDLLGRIRLAVECNPCSQLQFDREGFDARLSNRLGGYFSGPVVYADDGRSERRRLAQALLRNAGEWPEEWPHAVLDPLSGAARPLNPGQWKAIRRTLSKESWLSSVGTPPWPLRPEASVPTVVSFYSFKGGVGRTTLLSVVARNLASRGIRSAVIDLDLEAPGASTFLTADSAGGRGVVDFLVDHMAAGRADIDGLHGQPADIPAEEAARIHVFPAGRLDRAYLEKLGRLDFASQLAGSDSLSPVHAALDALLRKIRAELKPQFILIDSRAGIHDLGGLSLHALAHVDVLVSRAVRQAYPGIGLALGTLRQRRGVEELRCMLVHTFAPLPAEGAAGAAEREAFRREVYALFDEHVYAHSDKDVPQEEDDTALHFPWVLPLFTELERAQSIADVPSEIYRGAAVRAITTRLLALSGLESDDADDEVS